RQLHRLAAGGGGVLRLAAPRHRLRAGADRPRQGPGAALRPAPGRRGGADAPGLALDRHPLPAAPAAILRPPGAADPGPGRGADAAGGQLPAAAGPRPRARRGRGLLTVLLRPRVYLMQPIIIVDYGMANLRSVQKAFEKVGHAAAISGDPGRVAEADKLVL